MKGIILAGGYGTRLHPLTLAVSKHLLPVYNKPMIYYPLSILMLTGIRDILLISTPADLPLFQRFLGSGQQWGIRLEYQEQKKPHGLADAFRLGAGFIDQSPSCLILGDNIFFGDGLPRILQRTAQNVKGACIFAYPVSDPHRYGVVEFDDNGRVIRLVEKPAKTQSHYAIPGLYFYDGQAAKLAAQLKPSSRGELEITDLNRIYLEHGELNVEILGRGFAWLDAGTHESLLQASTFIQAVEERQGMMISCPEEIAFRMGYIDQHELSKLAEKYKNNSYGNYLFRLAQAR